MPDLLPSIPKEPARSHKRMSKVRLRERIFARHYVATLNGTKSAIAAGYSEKGANVKGARLLAKDTVQAEIKRLSDLKLEELGVTSHRVLEELARMGFANMGDYIKTQADGSAYVDLSTLSREQAAAIQEITVDEYVEGKGEEAREVRKTKLKLAEKRGSLELLGNYLALFNKQATGVNIGALHVNVSYEKSEVRNPKALVIDSGTA